MQNIKVKRYQEPNAYVASVEPQDESWVLFVPKEGHPELWVQVEGYTADGAAVKGYVPAGTMPEEVDAATSEHDAQGRTG